MNANLRPGSTGSPFWTLDGLDSGPGARRGDFKPAAPPRNRFSKMRLIVRACARVIIYAAIYLEAAVIKLLITHKMRHTKIG